MIYVFAGTAHQAHQWMRDNNRSPKDARYIDRTDRLRGIERGLEFVRVGTWYDRKDGREIEHALAARDAVELPSNVEVTGKPPRGAAEAR
jgi:hypothetical protein